MQLIIGTTDEVKFSVPSGVAAASFTVKQGETTSAPINAAVVDDVAVCTIPYANLTSPGELEVTLTFNYQSGTHTKTEYVEVIKPYIELFQLKGMYPGKSDEQLIELETIARQRVEAFCGQDFYYYPDATYQVVSSGEKTLELPKRIIRLEDVTTDGMPLPAGYEVSDYYLTYGDVWLGIKDAPPDWFMGEVTSFPYLDRSFRFGRNRVYSVTGDWGFQTVPGPVISAMKTLIKHYASRTAEMQEAGLKSAKSADWALTFGGSASGNEDTTGNSHADSLLGDYQVNRWVVV